MLNITVHTGIAELSTIRAFLWRDSKMRKPTISFVMSARLSAWTNSTPTGGFLIFVRFSKI